MEAQSQSKIKFTLDTDLRSVVCFFVLLVPIRKGKAVPSSGLRGNLYPKLIHSEGAVYYYTLTPSSLHLERESINREQHSLQQRERKEDQNRSLYRPLDPSCSWQAYCLSGVMLHACYSILSFRLSKHPPLSWSTTVSYSMSPV